MLSTKEGSGHNSLDARRSSSDRLYKLPKLEELATNPDKAAVLDARTAQIVASKALSIFAASLYRLLVAPDVGNRERVTPKYSSANGTGIPPDLDDVTSVDEIAKAIGKERRWITRNAATLPFVIRLSRKNYVCSKSGFMRWLNSRSRGLRKS
jgi:hypothetical protein